MLFEGGRETWQANAHRVFRCKLRVNNLHIANGFPVTRVALGLANKAVVRVSPRYTCRGKLANETGIVDTHLFFNS